MRLRRDRKDLDEKTGNDLDAPLQLGLGEELVRRHEHERIAMEVRAADLAAREARADELAARIQELEHALAQAAAEHGRRVAHLETRLDEERAANAEHRRRFAGLEQQLGNERAALGQARAEVARLQSSAEELAGARRHGRELEIAVHEAQQEVLGERRKGQRVQVRLLEAVQVVHRKVGEIFERQLHELEQGRLALGDVAGLEAADEPHLAPHAEGPEDEGRQLPADGAVAQDAASVPIADASTAAQPTFEVTALEAQHVGTPHAASET
jgi:chromosome segregation ATPase